MILVDSSVWIDYFNGTVTPESTRLDAMLGVQAICLGDLILAEILRGFRHNKDYKTAKALLESLTIYDLAGKNIAIKSAENYRLLQAKGITIRKTIDTLIATFFIENHLPILHSDRDFQAFHQHLNLKNALMST